MERYLFDFTKKKTMLTVSIADISVADTICTIRNAIYNGADAFMFHMERMHEEPSDDDLKHMFSYVQDRPIMTLNYRQCYRKSTDEELMEGQLRAIRAGASCCDIYGDVFDPSENEITKDSTAIAKQKNLIDEVHEAGGQVLISSHIWKHLNCDVLTEQAKRLEERGADIVKLAVMADTEEEMYESFETTLSLKRNLSVPFIHICMGKYGKLHRAVAPLMGACMTFCVQEYIQGSNLDKPLLKSMKAVYDNLDCGYNR